MGNFFDNGSMSMIFHILNVLYDGRCGLSRNEDIRRFVGKLVEKQTLDYRIINSETSIKYMAEYDYILKREKKGNYNGHVELHQAGRNGYETSEEDKNGHEI